MTKSLEAIGVENPEDVAKLLETFRPKRVMEDILDETKSAKCYLETLIIELGYKTEC